MIHWVPDSDRNWGSAVWQTPVGRLVAVFTGQALVAAEFADGPPARWFGRAVPPTPPPDWLEHLLALALTTTIGDVDWALVDPGVTPLQQRALAWATRIPYGSTCSYGRLAAAMGAPGRARLVGQAMGRSPAALFIPTHRVVRADGEPAPGQRGGTAADLRRYEAARVVRTGPLAQLLQEGHGDRGPKTRKCPPDAS